MKRPEKKEVMEYSTVEENCYGYGEWEKGYNKAIDDFNKCLPTEEEIDTIIHNHYLRVFREGSPTLAKEISERINK